MQKGLVWIANNLNLDQGGSVLPAFDESVLYFLFLLFCRGLNSLMGR